MYEYVYGIVAHQEGVLKIGRWSGTIANLRVRYRTYYSDFEMIVFQTNKGESPLHETSLHTACEAHRICRELFKLDALEKFIEHASIICLKSCQSVDFDTKCRLLERKRYSFLARENALLNGKNMGLKRRISELEQDKMVLKQDNMALKQENMRQKQELDNLQRPSPTVTTRKQNNIFQTWIDENVLADPESVLSQPDCWRRFQKEYPGNKQKDLYKALKKLIGSDPVQQPALQRCRGWVGFRFK